MLKVKSHETCLKSLNSEIKRRLRPIRDGVTRTPRAANRAALRAIALVEAVAAASTPLYLDELIQATGIARATAYRLIAVLSASGVLLKEPRGRGYSAGRRLTSLALSLMSNAAFRNDRHSILQALVAQIGETCNFTTLDAGSVLYIDRVEAAWPLRLSLQPGSRTPIHATSSGKLYLALMPSVQRRRFLVGAPIPRFTEKTITDPAELEADLKRVRKSRVGVDDEGYLAGLVSVAVPVYGLRRTVIGTVSVHAPKARLSLERALGFVPQLRKAASDLGSEYRRIAASG